MKILAKIDEVLRGFIIRFFGPPPFRFNRELYAELIRRRKNGRRVQAPSDDPRVEFTLGPIDGTLGEYKPKEKRIVVDVLECFIYVLHKGGVCSPAELARRFDQRVTKTLAHEGGHWNLHKRHDRLVTFEKAAISICLLALGLLMAFILVSSINNLVLRNLAPKLMADHFVLGIIITALLLLVILIIFTRLFRSLALFWLMIAGAVTYVVCYDERYARRREKEAMGDPDWEDVIEV